MRTILLLTISNIFMTFAWYGHLKYRNEPSWKVVLISWGIAFFEYCFQVPANRIGSYEFNAAQLKTIQEVITLSVFSVFSIRIWERNAMELRRRVRLHLSCGFFHFSQMVAAASTWSLYPKLFPSPAVESNPQTKHHWLTKGDHSCNAKLPQYGRRSENRQRFHLHR